MDQGQGQERTQLTGDPDQRASELRSEIEEAREDLGDTAAALAAKTDVKARARERVEEIKHSASDKKDEMLSGVRRTEPGAATSSGVSTLRAKARQNPVPTAAIGALIGGFLLGRLTRRDQ